MCDDVMERVMMKLGIDIPEFLLQRYIGLEKNKDYLYV